MAYDTFEITEFKLQLDPDRAEAVLAVAGEHGEEAEDVSHILGDIFCCPWLRGERRLALWRA